MERNVLAEIPGRDPKLAAQVVMIGAHFDSWHSGTGSTDNGCGSAVMIEAMRLLTRLCEETGAGPRRTIRIGLWSGEEQGLLGSRAYVAAQVAAPGAERGAPPSELHPLHAKLSGYYNLDNGTGRIRGVYLQGNEAVAAIFRAWLRPFHDLGAATLTLADTGGTDHLAFHGVGVPGFQFIQDPVAYGTRTHHSNMDVWDHAIADDLRQAATIIASFAWHTAQRDEMLPRLSMAVPVEAASGR
jgi:Zn-dependent M28 family amino/carboxypeptidase